MWTIRIPDKVRALSTVPVTCNCSQITKYTEDVRRILYTAKTTTRPVLRPRVDILEAKPSAIVCKEYFLKEQLTLNATPSKKLSLCLNRCIWFRYDIDL